MHTLTASNAHVTAPADVSDSDFQLISVKNAPRIHSNNAGVSQGNVVARAEPLPPILVADDDEDDRYFIERLIKKTGIPNPVRTFDDGSEVVNFLGGSRLSTPA